MIKIQYALNKVTDQLVHVTSPEIIKGLNSQVECICCGENLIAKAKESKKLTTHFSHQSKTKCFLKNMNEKEAMDAYGETLLHKKAKELFEKEKELYIPYEVITSIEKNDLNLNFFPKEKIKFLGKNYPIISVELEKTEGNFKPDLKIMVKEINPKNKDEIFEILVEIAVTHFVDDIKKNKIIYAKKNCIQINLNNFPREDIENLTKVTTEIKNPQRYELVNFYFPSKKLVETQLTNKYNKKLDLHNQKIINDREKLIKDGICGDKIIQVKNSFNKSIQCLCCGGEIIKQNDYFFHPKKENCIIFSEQPPNKVFNKYNEIKALKIFKNYLEYLQQNNKKWGLSNKTFYLNRNFNHKGFYFSISKLNYFNDNSFNIYSIEENVKENYLLVSLKNEFLNDYKIKIKFYDDINIKNNLLNDNLDILFIKLDYITNIQSKDHFYLQKELISWKNHNFYINENNELKAIQLCKQQKINSIDKKIEQEEIEKTIIENKKIEEELKKEALNKLIEIKTNKLFETLDSTIEDLYNLNCPISLKNFTFYNGGNEIVYPKNPGNFYIKKYRKHIFQNIPYYELCLYNKNYEINVILFISVNHNHSPSNLENTQYILNLKYNKIENLNIDLTTLMKDIINNIDCEPTLQEKKILINDFNEKKIQIEKQKQEKNHQIEMERIKKIQKEKFRLEQENARLQKEKEEKIRLEKENDKKILEEKKQLILLSKKQEINSKLNNLLGKLIYFTKENQQIKIKEIDEIKFFNNNLISFNINKKIIVFVLNNCENHEHILLTKILDMRETTNLDIGCIFFSKISNIENNLLLISNENLKIKKIDLIKKYDKIRYFFMLLDDYEKALKNKIITEKKLISLVKYYIKNKNIFINKFNEKDIKKVDNAIPNILKLDSK